MVAVRFLNSVYLCILTLQLATAQRIAELKCQEYRSLTVSRVGIIPLIARPMSIVHEDYNCTATVEVIAGGEEALEGEFPHHALLGWESIDYSTTVDFVFLCGAVLISEWYVVSAGHCIVDGERGTPVVVRLGEYDLNNDYDHQVDFDVERAIRHPSYKVSSVYNDIALVKVKRRIRFSPYIRPACLWTAETFNFSSVIATGFGQLGFLTEQATKLNKVKLELYDGALCDRTFRRNRKFKHGLIDSQICAGSENEKDTCKGDSGGPLQVMVEDNGCTYYVVGLTSRGQDACGLMNSVAIYTRISSYVKWIENVVWDEDADVWK